MNKDKLIDLLTYRGYTYNSASVLIDGLLEVITDALANHETVKIGGLGSFNVRRRASYEGFNPHTMQRCTVEGQYSVAFTPSLVMKRICRERYDIREEGVLDPEQESGTGQE